MATSGKKSGRKGGRTARQIRYLFAIGYLTASGKGSARKITAHPEKLSKISGPAAELARKFAERRSDSSKKPSKTDDVEVKPKTPKAPPQPPKDLPELSRGFEDYDRINRRERQEFLNLLSSSGAEAKQQAMDGDAKQALGDYTSEGYRYINARLRGTTDQLDPQEKIDSGFADFDEVKAIKDLQRAFDTAAVSLPQDRLLHRGVYGEFGQELLQRHAAGQLIGATLQDAGFLSTSTGVLRAQDFTERGDHRTLGDDNAQGVIIRITPSANTKGLPILDGRETEVVLPASLKTVVTAVRSTDTGFSIIDVAVVDDD